MAIQTLGGNNKVDIGCIAETCDEALPATVGPTATTCYKTKVCKDDKKAFDKEALLSGTWRVEYYNQQVDADDSLTPLDSYTSPVFQNYVKIANMPIIMENSISVSIDPNTGAVTGTGNGKLINLFRPFVGDVIIGNYGNIRYLFKITSVVPTNIGDSYAYEIAFTVMSQVASNNQEYNSLLDKVITELVFDDTNGLMTQADVDNSTSLEPFLLGSLKRYMETLSKKGYLFLKKGGKNVYDPAMTKFVKALIPNICANMRISQIPMTSNSVGPNVLDGLLDRDLALVTGICRKRCLTNVSEITHYSSEAVYVVSHTDYIVGSDYEVFPETTGTLGCGDPFPPTPVNPNEEGLDPDCMPLDPPCCFCGSDPLNDVNTGYGRTIELDDGTIRLIKDPIAYETYIFSPAYYNGTVADMSYLEKLVYKYMHNEAVTIADILPLWRDVIHWCSHSWFYYMPILMLLSKYAQGKRGECAVPITTPQGG